MATTEEKRKIWSIGKSKESKTGKGRKGTYVVSIPVAWAEQVGGDGTEIIVSSYKGGLLLSPGGLWNEPKEFPLSVRDQSISLLKYKIISAYLNNYEEIRVICEKPREDLETLLKELNDKLLGFSYANTGKNETVIAMSTTVKPVYGILQKMLSQAHLIHEINQDAFSDFRIAKAKSEKVEEIERDIDKYSYLVKRLFCVAAEQPEEYGQIGIGDLPRLVHWETLNTNLERVGDLQHEINLELQRYSENKKKPDVLSTPSYSFKDYHAAAQKMIDDAYSQDPNKITEILDAKKFAEEDPKHRGNYIPLEKAKSIQSMVLNNPELRCLDVRIWGLTGCATNIAEAWLNMKGPLL